MRLGPQHSLLMTVKVKVCGITNLADAEKALEYGADMLGVNFYPPSSRSIAPEKAREILQALPGGRQAYSGLQFHGEENAIFCRGWGMKVIKAFRVKEKNSLAGMKDFPVDFYLLDSWSTGYGGSGERFPWEWLDGIDTNKLILSGGLRVNNVADAIHRLHS